MNSTFNNPVNPATAPISRKTNHLLFIPNPDGSPRWIFPANIRQPLFLKFYHMEGFRSRAFGLLAKAVFLLRIPSLVYPRWNPSAELPVPEETQMTDLPVPEETQVTDLPVPEEIQMTELPDSQWALFTGTAGPNNKKILYLQRKKNPVFLKIPTTAASKKMVEKELEGTARAAALKPESFRIPSARMLANGTVEMEDIGPGGKRSNSFSPLHARALQEIYRKTAKPDPSASETCLMESSRSLARIRHHPDPRIPENLISKLEKLEVILDRTPFVTTLGHGDFTPWNMYVRNGALSIYDWELAAENLPLGFDAFHFVMQKGILIDRKPWKEIRSEIAKRIDPWGEMLGREFGTQWSRYLKYYLYTNITRQLELYSRQENWHEQVSWLMNTWNEALSDTLAGSTSETLTDRSDNTLAGSTSETLTDRSDNTLAGSTGETLADRSDNTLAGSTGARGLILDDIFGYLNNKPYAAIKFPPVAPSTLDPFSDVDLCLGRNDSGQLVDILRHHPLVLAVTQRKSSFMNSVQIIPAQGEPLHLDLIWQLKWKHLQMMDAGEVLKYARINSHGIKTMHPNHLATYLGLFYGLNNTRLPEKYLYALDDIRPESSPPYKNIFTACRKETLPKNELMKTLKNNTANKNFRGIRNRIRYFFDTMRRLAGPKGMIITFSGVDGAGKSTVIDHVRREFEKKHRRPVVVLRHRPSLLPILSAWTKGKEKAEQDAASTLPRQGTNSSMLSSLARFLYYYTDYLAGQFVVYMRHVRRGTVVLYDRYYFDFINDSVRSNIRLPEPVLRAGYRFLMKPDFNFFLYADAETILARKKELDKNTITALTGRYLALFRQLAKGGETYRYIAIENNHLEATIDRIIRNTTRKAA